MSLFAAMGSALYSHLAAGTALINALGGTAIYNTLAPQGVAPPYVVFSLSSGVDENSSPRRARSLVYTVKAISTSQADAEALDDLIDARLHDQTLTIADWGNYWTARESDFVYSELVGGVLYWHRGAQYRIKIAE